MVTSRSLCEGGRCRFSSFLLSLTVILEEPVGSVHQFRIEKHFDDVAPKQIRKSPRIAPNQVKTIVRCILQSKNGNDVMNVEETVIVMMAAEGSTTRVFPTTGLVCSPIWTVSGAATSIRGRAELKKKDVAVVVNAPSETNRSLNILDRMKIAYCTDE
jgi:hypothetical protein